MSKDDGGPAFPFYLPHTSEQWHEDANWGMSLRDYFASMAVMRTVPMNEDRHLHPDANDIARYAYKIADAMLAARAAQDDTK